MPLPSKIRPEELDTTPEEPGFVSAVADTLGHGGSDRDGFPALFDAALAGAESMQRTIESLGQSHLEFIATAAEISPDFERPAVEAMAAAIETGDPVLLNFERLQLSGVGITPTGPFDASPATLDFGAIQIDAVSGHKKVALTNHTGQDQRVDFDIIGPDSPEFFLVQETKPAVIPAGQAGTVDLVFAPLTALPKHATLTIRVAPIIVSREVALRGTGTPKT